ncbi:Uncharacterised protein [Vibrio cholerae]|nr:Uncharacterised protein [Vibrio cholerae]
MLTAQIIGDTLCQLWAKPLCPLVLSGLDHLRFRLTINNPLRI